MPTELAKAYVQILPSARGLTKELQSLLNDNMPEGNSSGEQFGGGFAAGLGKALAAAAKTTVAAVGAATAAVGAISKKALDSYKDYEQLTGGVQKLYGDAAGTIMKQASEAYKTVGMNANDYMETATSFSAALVSSLGGDVNKAAAQTDVAMRSISDNVNVFGSNFEDVENAFKGFAKGNYTMLDNLKIGYGGTKEEMARLLADAEQLSGVKYNLSSFSDIVTAIDVVQQHMGIAGTTAKESASTIEGSVNTMKAAWDNWLTGLADENADLAALTDNLVDSVITAAGNIVPRLQVILGRLGGAIQEQLPKLLPIAAGLIADLAPGMVRAGLTLVQSVAGVFVTMGPKLAKQGTAAAVNLINGLSSGAAAGIPKFLSQALPLVTKFTESLRKNAGKLVDAGLNLLQNIVKGIANSLPTLIAYVPTIVTNVAGVINDNAPKVLKAGVEMIKTLAKGIINALPALKANIPQIINAIVSVWSAFNWLSLGKSAINAIKNGVNALKSTVPAAVKDMGSKAVNLFKSINWANVGKAVINLLKGGISGLASAIPAVLRSIGSKGMSAFKAINWRSVGTFVVNGIKAGVSSAAGALFGTLKNLASRALNAAKSALKIQSPSKVFRDEVGKWIPAGMAEGIDMAGNLVELAVKKVSNTAVSESTKAVRALADKAVKSVATTVKKHGKVVKRSNADISKDILDAAQKRLDNYKVYHAVSLAEETAYWEKIKKATKKGTQAHTDAVAKYKEAKAAQKEAAASYNAQLIAMEEDYAKAVQDVQDTLAADTNALWDEYEKSVSDRAKSLYSALGGLFSAFKSETENTTQTLLSNLRSQVDGMNDWRASLSALANRGLDSALLDELRELGPAAAADVALMASMTDTELSEYQALWREKTALCTQQATEEMAGLKESVTAQVAQMRVNAAKELATLSANFAAGAADLARKAVKEVGKLPSQFKSIGIQTSKGMIAGIQSQESEITAAAKKVAKAAVTAAKKALGIKSPSRVFRDEVGKWIPEGMAAGIDLAGGAVTDAVDTLAADAVLAGANVADALEDSFSAPLQSRLSDALEADSGLLRAQSTEREGMENSVARGVRDAVMEALELSDAGDRSISVQLLLDGKVVSQAVVNNLRGQAAQGSYPLAGLV